MKYKDKAAFLLAVSRSWEDLLACSEQLTPQQIGKRVRATSGDLGWSASDVWAHLYAWHRLFLGWYKVGLNGMPDLPAKGFNWRQTPELNRQFHAEFTAVAPASVRRRLKLSHGRVMKIVAGLSNDQLMNPGHFQWTRKLGLISYVSANTDSHYRWATKKIRSLYQAPDQEILS